MKRLLLVTTALAGVALLGAQAFAETANTGFQPDPEQDDDLESSREPSDPSIIGTDDGSDFRTFSTRNRLGNNGGLQSRNFSGTNSRFIDEAGDRESPIIQQEPAFAVKLAGTVRVDAQFIDQDEEVEGLRSNFALFDNRRDFSVFGTASSANGLTYGFEIDVGTQRAEMFLLSDFGRLSLGDTFSATEALDVGGRSVMVGFGHYALGGSKNVNTGTLQGAGVTSFRGQGGTVRYTTPNYNGLTLAASYTAESDTDMLEGSGFQTSEDIIGIAGQYTTHYGNYTAILYAGYEYSRVGSVCNTGGSTTPTDICDFPFGDTSDEGDESQQLFSTGFVIRGMGASLGFGYGHYDSPLGRGDLSGGNMNNDKDWFDMGVSYASGPWSVSAGASLLWDEEGCCVNGDSVEGEAIAVSGSFNYILAPGLSIGGGITVHDISDASFDTTEAQDEDQNSDFIDGNDAVVVSISTLMNF